jgi:NAD-dependent dihydropyrimidine dehydrogenase PreA subunit
MGKMIYLKNVTTLRLQEDRCVGCGMCLAVCPHEVFALNNGKAKIRDRDACMECGACARNCPTEAIRVQAGVGCAAAVINTALGRKNSACCCVIEPQDGPGAGKPGKGSCC